MRKGTHASRVSDQDGRVQDLSQQELPPKKPSSASSAGGTQATPAAEAAEAMNAGHVQA